MTSLSIIVDITFTEILPKFNDIRFRKYENENRI